MHMVNGQWVCDCKEPCSTAKRGETTYTYENMDSVRFRESRKTRTDGTPSIKS
ncbi:hypothetical protein QMP26_19545 [Enterocloster clostridioformis]